MLAHSIDFMIVNNTNNSVEFTRVGFIDILKYFNLIGMIMDMIIEYIRIEDGHMIARIRADFVSTEYVGTPEQGDNTIRKRFIMKYDLIN